MNNKVTAIVLAAGQGKRMHSPVAKQFLILRDKPVVYYSLKAFEMSSVDEIILVTGEGQVEYCREHIVKAYDLGKVAGIIEGGKERYDSVHHALMNCTNSDYVLIHDGARPFINVNSIEEMILKVRECKACIYATPVKETIKEVDGEGIITATPDRATLWTAQTPQAFEYEEIRGAYEQFYVEKESSQKTVTDDAMVYETYLGKPVRVLRGDYHNIKLTTPEDLIIAEQIMGQLPIV
jgi:2-C-methyl-D-erythritol 4-phosphate cytidylyltransferase